MISFDREWLVTQEMNLLNTGLLESRQMNTKKKSDTKKCEKSDTKGKLPESNKVLDLLKVCEMPGSFEKEVKRVTTNIPVDNNVLY